MGRHIWNLYHRGSQNKTNHWAGKMPKRPNNVSKTVPPNQYLVNNGKLLNQSWISPPMGIFLTGNETTSLWINQLNVHKMGCRKIYYLFLTTKCYFWLYYWACGHKQRLQNVNKQLIQPQSLLESSHGEYRYVQKSSNLLK